MVHKLCLPLQVVAAPQMPFTMRQSLSLLQLLLHTRNVSQYCVLLECLRVDCLRGGTAETTAAARGVAVFAVTQAAEVGAASAEDDDESERACMCPHHSRTAPGSMRQLCESVLADRGEQRIVCRRGWTGFFGAGALGSSGGAALAGATGCALRSWGARRWWCRWSRDRRCGLRG